ncbi:MAG: sigma-70 family RNA polymerase sigma factor [Myxococcales bacterium]|nr:sigma-70 family RNA polymerase sigma factor [Myxococcales bacterium]
MADVSIAPSPSVAFDAADDASLAAACAGGDREAMSRLYVQYRRRVYSLAYRMVGKSDAEELAHDVFIRIYRGIGGFRGDCALSSWIYRLGMNTALSRLAKQKRRREVSETDEAALDAMPDEKAHLALQRDPHLAATLQLALERLPAGYRAIVVLHDVEGLSHEESAEVLGCTVGTSKSQLHKARLRLRGELAHLHPAKAGA